jgi:2-phosphoglycolate phosphatase
MFLNKVDTVLFDLDGTLLDSYQDLSYALNQTLVKHGKPELALEQIRPFVSKGAMVMICVAFHCKPQSDQAHELWLEMLDIYENNIAQFTTLFPGMGAVLDDITSSGKQWGIVTNKPGYLTEILLGELNLVHKPQTVVSGDTLKVKKPHPEPLLLACSNLGSTPERCVYVGDDERDIQAGKSANMYTIAAAYGYIVAEENPIEWNADVLINHAGEIKELLNKN